MWRGCGRCYLLDDPDHETARKRYGQLLDKIRSDLTPGWQSAYEEALSVWRIEMERWDQMEWHQRECEHCGGSGIIYGDRSEVPDSRRPGCSSGLVWFKEGPKPREPAFHDFELIPQAMQARAVDSSGLNRTPRELKVWLQ